MAFNDLTDDRPEKRLEEPCQTSELALPQRVTEMMNLDSDILESKDLLQTFLANLNIEFDVDSSVVEFE